MLATAFDISEARKDGIRLAGTPVVCQALSASDSSTGRKLVANTAAAW